MPETMPIADAMDVAQVALDGGTTTECLAGDYQPTTSMPVQAPLFEPPPFDFEEAYDELHRLDLRAKNRKSAWESLKGATRDAKEDYDSAINDLHDKFDEIDSARRVAAAVRQGSKPTEPTTEEVTPMPEEMEATIEEQPEEQQPEEPAADETPVE
jgi:hypothetical protein